MTIDSATLLRALTLACLIGLLLAIGLRLTAREVLTALRECRLTLVLAANFVAVPLVVVALARGFQLGTDHATGMILLGAAPFAPVVPVFARMARANLALAAGLTALMPVLCAFLTPWVSWAALRFVPGGGEVAFSGLKTLAILMATISVPLALGVAINQFAPTIKERLRRPVDVFSQATGVLSLIVVIAAEFRSILGLGWASLVTMVLAGEISLALGYSLGGTDRASRRVLGLGASNRNLALALLLAVESYPGTVVVPVVAADGLILILLGLLHVAWWRFTDSCRGVCRS